VIALINAERSAQGASPLSENGALDSAARAHSTDMAVNNFFNHTGSDGSSLGDRLGRVSYSYSAAAENIAAGQGTPSQVVAAWMGSTGHRLNILGDYTEIGVGYAYCSTSDWTVDFGKPPP
jgi:serralysin